MKNEVDKVAEQINEKKEAIVEMQEEYAAACEDPDAEEEENAELKSQLAEMKSDVKDSQRHIINLKKEMTQNAINSRGDKKKHAQIEKELEAFEKTIKNVGTEKIV